MIEVCYFDYQSVKNYLNVRCTPGNIIIVKAVGEITFEVVSSC